MDRSPCTVSSPWSTVTSMSSGLSPGTSTSMRKASSVSITSSAGAQRGRVQHLAPSSVVSGEGRWTRMEEV